MDRKKNEKQKKTFRNLNANNVALIHLFFVMNQQRRDAFSKFIRVKVKKIKKEPHIKYCRKWFGKKRQRTRVREGRAIPRKFEMKQITV